MAPGEGALDAKGTCEAMPSALVTTSGIFGTSGSSGKSGSATCGTPVSAESTAAEASPIEQYNRASSMAAYSRSSAYVMYGPMVA